MSIYSARDSVLVSPIQLGAQSAPQELLRKKAEGRGQKVLREADLFLPFNWGREALLGSSLRSRRRRLCQVSESTLRTF